MGGKQEVVCAVIGYGRRCVVGSEEHFAGSFLSNLQICGALSKEKWLGVKADFMDSHKHSCNGLQFHLGERAFIIILLRATMNCECSTSPCPVRYELSLQR